jgi:hypothetical protein
MARLTFLIDFAHQNVTDQIDFFLITMADGKSFSAVFLIQSLKGTNPVICS